MAMPLWIGDLRHLRKQKMQIDNIKSFFKWLEQLICPEQNLTLQ